MMDKKCCENCENCSYCHGGMVMEMECCKEHMMSKEHLTHKKEKLEKKLAWVNEELGKK